MTDMKPDEGTIYPAMRIAQLGIGTLEIAAMAFGSEYPMPHIRFSHEITIRDASKDPIGWGGEIFKGTLEELINLIGGKEVT